MITKIDPITDRATYDRVQARVNSMIDQPVRSPEEEVEVDMLLDELERYARKNFEFFQVQTDGVDDIISRLDLGMMQLEDILRVFGGPDRFFEYMTRQRDLDAATVEALVIEFDMERDQLQKPFRARPGGQDISPDLVQEPCEDPVCCPPDHVDWRVVLAESMREPTGIDRISQDMRVSA